MTENNVILLTIDALRADHLSSHGYDRETSPHLDRVAAQNVHYLNAFSASSHTREAVPSLLTGRFPTEAVDENFALAADSVATHLREAPHTTGAFHSNPYASRAYRFERDFDGFDDDLYFGNSKVIALLQRAFDKLRNRQYARAEEINERALEWLSKQDGPVFLWNHYMDVHGPYEPPEEYRNKFGDESAPARDPQKLYKRAAVTEPERITDEERREMVDRYDEEICYVDACIREFLSALENRGALRNSLVIITADHGDAFGEHGRYGHPRYLYDELVHVPMIVADPRMPESTVEAPVSTLDVVPTVLDFVGASSEFLPGVSLREVADTPDQFSERSVFSSARGEDENAHIRRFSARTLRERCFLERDIETGEVLPSRETDECDPALETALREHSANRLTAADSSGDGSDRETSDAMERRLEALGYKE